MRLWTFVIVSPEVTMPNRRIAQARGRETILECRITAYPHAVNYWEKNGRRIMSSAHHRIEAYDEGAHTITLSLRIYISDNDDYGTYRCVASNALGQDDGLTYLDGNDSDQVTVSTCQCLAVITHTEFSLRKWRDKNVIVVVRNIGNGERHVYVAW